MSDVRHGADVIRAALDALARGGCYTLFARRDGSYRAMNRSGYGEAQFVYEFLGRSPDSWSEALERGYVRVKGEVGFLPDAEVWVIVDRVPSPDLLLVVELPAPANPGSLLQGVLGLGRPEGLPAWLEHSLNEMLRKPSPVLITAEPGSGSEDLVAAFLERRFPAQSAEFFYPGRLSAAVQMRELFGDGAGARLGGEGTGVPIVDRGSPLVVIQEVSGLDLAVQMRLLEFLSGNSTLQWVFETTKDLSSLASAGLFSKALLKLAEEGRVVLPPLRRLRDEIGDEVARILNRLLERYHRKVGISRDAMDRILSMDWPGNWRQMERVLEQAYLTTTNAEIRPEQIRDDQWLGEADGLNLRKRTHALEKEILLEAYAMHSGNQVQMARALGISRGSLQYKMRIYGLQ